MNRRRYIWIGLAVTVFVAIGGFVLQPRSHGPRYQGKTVKGWLSIVKGDDSIFWTPEIVLMLDKLGSNAVPPLIEILDRDKTPIKDWFSIKAIQAQWVPGFVNSVAADHLRDSSVLPSQAQRALQYLGTNAACAIPELERITCDPKKEFAWGLAAVTLANLGPTATPALLRSLTNAPSSRTPALRFITEAALKNSLTNDDSSTRRVANEILNQLRSEKLLSPIE